MGEHVSTEPVSATDITSKWSPPAARKHLTTARTDEHDRTGTDDHGHPWLRAKGRIQGDFGIGDDVNCHCRQQFLQPKGKSVSQLFRTDTSGTNDQLTADPCQHYPLTGSFQQGNDGASDRTGPTFGDIAPRSPYDDEVTSIIAQGKTSIASPTIDADRKLAHPFTAPAVSPLTKAREKQMKATIMGNAAMDAPAIKRP